MDTRHEDESFFLGMLSSEDQKNFNKFKTIKSIEEVIAFFKKNSTTNFVIARLPMKGMFTIAIKSPRLSAPKNIILVNYNLNTKLKVGDIICHSMTAYARAKIISEKIEMLGKDEKFFIDHDNYVHTLSTAKTNDYVMNFLNAKNTPVGSFFIRPSSSGDEYLTAIVKMPTQKIVAIKYMFIDGKIYRMAEKNRILVDSISKDVQNLVSKTSTPLNKADFTQQETYSPETTPGSSKSTSAFILNKELKAAEATGKFSHSTSKIQKAKPTGTLFREKYENMWFSKSVVDAVLAEREVVAQEFFRLFIPYHPKTRMAISPASNFYVLSKEVERFFPLEKIAQTEINLNLKDGTYKGLGEVMVMALFMNETDLKAGNMGVDTKGRIFKIDGDWCFSSLRKPNANNKITLDVIKNLPYNTTYDAYNWFGVYEQGMMNPKNPTLDPSICNLEIFRDEVNKTMLKIMLMPYDLIKRMIGFYVHDSLTRDQLLNVVIDRKEQMKSAALLDPSFKVFMQSKEAEAAKKEFLKNLLDFTMTKKNKLVSDSKVDKELLANVNSDFNHLQQMSAAKQAPLTKDIQHKIPPEDEKKRSTPKR